MDQEDILMQITMQVFSADDVKVVQSVTLPDGSEAQATVAGKRVQLVGEPHGTFTLNLTGANAREWAAQPGESVTITVE
jgi:hypothetical protein